MSTSQEEDTNITTTKQTLQQDVQASIATLLQKRQTNNSDIAIDVYRTIQHESYLLVERQLILDALDNDPFGLMKVVNNDAEQSNVAKFEKFLQEEEDGNNTDDQKVNKDTVQSTTTEEDQEKQKNTELITRIKSMLRVISCTRTSTMDGYSSIHAIVQFDNDGSMDKNVTNHVRLHFTFLREPQNDSIDTAVDNGEDISSAVVEVEEDKKGCCSGRNKCDATTANGESNSSSSNGALDEQQPAKKRKRITKESDDESTAYVDEGNNNDSQSDDDTNNDNNKGGLSPKTIVTYKIDYSIDYGQQHQLLGVDIYALGKYPSVEEAVPMFDDDMDLEEQDSDNNEDNMNGSEEDDTKLTSMENTENDKKQSTNGEEFEDIVMSNEDGDDDDNVNDCCNNNNKGSCCNEEDTTNNDIENDGGDRFGVHINPENVVSFLDHMNINFNEQSVFYFLLSFPFYEHEWDISGFLLTALFDDEVGEDDEDEEEQMMNGDIGCESECPLPCCVPCNA